MKKRAFLVTLLCAALLALPSAHAMPAQELGILMEVTPGGDYLLDSLEYFELLALVSPDTALPDEAPEPGRIYAVTPGAYDYDARPRTVEALAIEPARVLALTYGTDESAHSVHLGFFTESVAPVDVVLPEDVDLADVSAGGAVRVSLSLYSRNTRADERLRGDGVEILSTMEGTIESVTDTTLTLNGHTFTIAPDVQAPYGHEVGRFVEVVYDGDVLLGVMPING